MCPSTSQMRRGRSRVRRCCSDPTPCLSPGCDLGSSSAGSASLRRVSRLWGVSRLWSVSQSPRPPDGKDGRECFVPSPPVALITPRRAQHAGRPNVAGLIKRVRWHCRQLECRANGRPELRHHRPEGAGGGPLHGRRTSGRRGQLLQSECPAGLRRPVSSTPARQIMLPRPIC